MDTPVNPTVVAPAARPAHDDAARPFPRVEGVLRRFVETPRLRAHSSSDSAPRRSCPGDPSSEAAAPVARGCRRAAASTPHPDKRRRGPGGLRRSARSLAAVLPWLLEGASDATRPPPGRKNSGAADAKASVTVGISHPGATRSTGIVGTGQVGASPARVFAFLEDLENHRLLTGRAVAIEELDGPPGARTGSRVQLRGPLGIRRRARTRMLDSRAPRWMIGCAEIGRGTLALISWTIAEDRTGSRVRLEAEIGRLGVFDRVLLALGGRRWMRRLFEESVTALAERLAPQAAGSAAAAPAPALEPALGWEGR
jgi:hypothetical protein